MNWMAEGSSVELVALYSLCKRMESYCMMTLCVLNEMLLSVACDFI